MLDADRNWLCRSAPEDVVAELEHDLDCSPLTARLLALRGIQGAEEADRFLAKRLKDLHRPEGMRDMEIAAGLLADAINHRRRILIHGDYDVDGSTSTALLRLFCQACRHDAIAWIPHRRIDGYGLSEASLEAVREHQADLMITVDCGIVDHGWAARIEAETDCRVIITDHHLPQDELPRCSAVCNPNRHDCDYPDRGLAGVGVAWKLAWATACTLCGGERISEELRRFLLDRLDLVAVGTVADCAPLVGENRILVHHGLKALARSDNPGLRALLELVNCIDVVNASDIGWRLGPLLNASGRIGSAMANIELLTATDRSSADEVLSRIAAENEERKRLTLDLTEELIASADTPEHRSRRTLVFAGDSWHPGIVGIVASRLADRFHKPAVVIALENGEGKGSLRTIPGVHLGHAIDACREHLIKGGGHAAAAGIAIAADCIDAFSAAFETWVRSQVGEPCLPSRDFDAEVAIAELDGAFFDELATLAPFGEANPEPLLRLRQAHFVSAPKLFGRDGAHIRGAVSDRGGGMHQFLAWKARDKWEHFSRRGSRFDLLVRPELNHWRGSVSHRLVLVDGRST